MFDVAAAAVAAFLHKHRALYNTHTHTNVTATSSREDEGKGGGVADRGFRKQRTLLHNAHSHKHDLRARVRKNAEKAARRLVGTCCSCVLVCNVYKRARVVYGVGLLWNARK